MTLKLDLGCGPNPKEGFIGLDQYTFNKEGVVQARLGEGVFIIEASVLGDVKLKSTPDGYILPDNSVDEVHSAHFLEHLEMNQANPQRIAFCNELFRIMKPDAVATIIVPHWCSNRAMGDWTHADKPVTEMFHYYLNRDWRAGNAPHCDKQYNPDGLDCHFDCTWGYVMREDLKAKNQEQQMFALANYKEAAQDLYATWKAIKMVTTPPETVALVADRINGKGKRGRPRKSR